MVFFNNFNNLKQNLWFTNVTFNFILNTRNSSINIWVWTILTFANKLIKQGLYRNCYTAELPLHLKVKFSVFLFLVNESITMEATTHWSPQQNLVLSKKLLHQQINTETYERWIKELVIHLKWQLFAKDEHPIILITWIP